NFSAKLEGVLAPQIGNVIQDFQDAVRTHDFGPTSSDTVTDAAEAGVDGRHSKIKRIRDPRGHDVGGPVKRVVRRIDGVVVAEEALIIVSVAKAGFIHPVGIGGPGPAPRTSLRPRVLL